MINKVKTINNWSTDPENKIPFIKKPLGFLSILIRNQHFDIFWESFKPNKNTKVLDMGMTPDETLPDANFFEKRYPYIRNLTAASVENCNLLVKNKYPLIKFIQVEPGNKLPFRDNEFEIVTSWATLEHVGNEQQQRFFMKELFRIGKKVFITTPDRGCFYEPHSCLLFVHWLPLKYFYGICGLIGKKFWASENNLRPLGKNDVLKIIPKGSKNKIIEFEMFGFIFSHLIIIKQ